MQGDTRKSAFLKLNTSTSLFLLVMSCLVIIGSIITARQVVYSKEELFNVRLGWPVPFVWQDLSRYDPPFPYEARLGSPWETPMQFLFPQFIFSFGIVFVAVFLLWAAFVRVLSWTGKRNFKLEQRLKRPSIVKRDIRRIGLIALGITAFLTLVEFLHPHPTMNDDSVYRYYGWPIPIVLYGEQGRQVERVIDPKGLSEEERNKLIPREGIPVDIPFAGPVWISTYEPGLAGYTISGGGMAFSAFLIFSIMIFCYWGMVNVKRDWLGAPRL